MRKPSESVSFRLNKDVLDALDERCRTTKLSRGELCRAIVIAGLVTPQSEEVYAHLQCVENRILSALTPLKKQQKLLAYLLNAMVMATAKVSREQAADFVRAEFLDKVGDA